MASTCFSIAVEATTSEVYLSCAVGCGHDRHALRTVIVAKMDHLEAALREIIEIADAQSRLAREERDLSEDGLEAVRAAGYRNPRAFWRKIRMCVLNFADGTALWLDTCAYNDRYGVLVPVGAREAIPENSSVDEIAQRTRLALGRGHGEANADPHHEGSANLDATSATKRSTTRASRRRLAFGMKPREVIAKGRAALEARDAERGVSARVPPARHEARKR